MSTVRDMMVLIAQQWHSLFDFFEPRELKILMFASLQATKRALVVFARYFAWWLMVWACLIDLFVDGEGLFGRFWEYLRPMWRALGVDPRVHILTVMVVVLCVILSVRPSIEAKHFRYFTTKLPRIFLFSMLFFLVPQVYSVPLFWVASFFFFDTINSLRGLVNSLYNATVFVAAYLPFLLLHGAAHGIVYHLYRFLWDCVNFEEHHFIAYTLKYAGSFALYLFFVAMLGVFYTRIVSANSHNPLFLRMKRGAK